LTAQSVNIRKNQSCSEELPMLLKSIAVLAIVFFFI